MKSATKLRAAFIGCAMTFLLLIQLLSQHPQFVEDYYSNGLYPIIRIFVSGISNSLPFSLAECALWALILIGIPWYIYRIRNKRRNVTRILLNILTVLSIIVVWFYLFWGINYLRVPLKSKMHLERVAVAPADLDSTFINIIRSANELNKRYTVQSHEEINKKIVDAYEPILEDLSIHQIGSLAGKKSFLGNWILNKSTSSGWFSPFTHEVHYNSDLIFFELPFVLAHEKAHLLGFTSEAEANFLAYLVCQSSDDALIQYSGYFSLLGYFLTTVRNDSSRRALFVKNVSESVKLDLAAVRQRWLSHRGLFSKVSNKTYDLYLKANQVKEGLANYSRVVDLVVRYEVQESRPRAASKHGNGINVDR